MRFGTSSELPPFLIRFEGGPATGRYHTVEHHFSTPTPPRFMEFEVIPNEDGLKRGQVVRVLLHRYERGAVVNEVTGRVWPYVFVETVIGAREY